MGEALPEGATQSMEELDHGSPDMGGFTLSFMIPFERTEVYDELLVDDNPLGSSPNVAYTILRPGYDGEAVRDRRKPTVPDVCTVLALPRASRHQYSCANLHLACTL